MPDSTSSRRFAHAGLAVLAVYFLYFCGVYWNSVLFDFAPIYAAGKIFRAGRWECFYDFLLQDQPSGFRIFTGHCLSRFAVEMGFPTDTMPMTLYLYSPAFIPFAAPLTLLPWQIVEKAVLLANTAAVVAIIVISVRAVAPRRIAPALLALLAALILTGEPTRWCVFTGQATPWMLLLTLGAWQLGERGGRWEWAAGALLALAFWMKFFPGLFVLYWLRGGRWRAIGAFAGAAAAWFAVGWAVFGAEVHRAWLDTLRAMGTGVGIFPVNQSFESALLRWRLPIQSAVTEHNYFLPAGVKLLALLGKGLVLGALLSTMIRPAACPRRRALQAAMTLAVCPLLFSVSWNHYAIFTLPLTAWLLAAAWAGAAENGDVGKKINIDIEAGVTRRRMAMAVVAALLAILMFQYLHMKGVNRVVDALIGLMGRRAAEPLAQILLSRHLIGSLLFIAAGAAAWWLMAPEVAESPAADRVPASAP